MFALIGLGLALGHAMTLAEAESVQRDVHACVSRAIGRVAETACYREGADRLAPFLTQNLGQAALETWMAGIGPACDAEAKSQGKDQAEQNLAGYRCYYEAMVRASR